jgi:hypothetical protein
VRYWIENKGNHPGDRRKNGGLHPIEHMSDFIECLRDSNSNGEKKTMILIRRIFLPENYPMRGKGDVPAGFAGYFTLGTTRIRNHAVPVIYKYRK